MESDDESIVLEKRDKMNVDVLLKNVWLYQTVTQTFVQRNVAIKNDKFYYIYEEENVNLQPQKTINAENQWMIPGLIDAHMHIESSMTTPTIFSKAVVRYGVTMLPTSLLSYMEYNYDPTVSAISVLLMLLTMGLMFLIEKTLGLASIA